MRSTIFARGDTMIRSSSARGVVNLGIASALAVFLGACGSMSLPSFSSGPTPPPEPAVAPDMPATIRADEIAGRWGLASYQNPNDRLRTEKAALGQCKQPYVISMGPTGGVMMHLADQPKPEELRLKGAPGGKTFIGPDGEAGGQGDREVVQFNGRVLALRWVDPEVQGRYGTMVYVRCGPEGEQRPRPAAKPKPKPRPA